jgi:hypothetical protein
MGKTSKSYSVLKKLIENIFLKNHFIILEIFLALHILMTSGIIRTAFYSLQVFGV